MNDKSRAERYASTLKHAQRTMERFEFQSGFLAKLIPLLSDDLELRDISETTSDPSKAYEIHRRYVQQIPNLGALFEVKFAHCDDGCTVWVRFMGMALKPEPHQHKTYPEVGLTKFDTHDPDPALFDKIAGLINETYRLVMRWWEIEEWVKMRNDP